MNSMDFHEIANIFPLMQGDEYNNLRDDIFANGLREAIWTYQGKIIDGRNRYHACLELGIEPHYQEWNGSGSLVAFVVSMNLHRRHLTSSQRAMIALDIEKYFAIEAKEKELLRKSTLEIFPKSELESIHAADQAAKVAKTNPHYVTDAKKLVDQAPDLAEQVRAGKLTIPRAKFALAERNKVEPEPVAGKYRVIYADPPWKYGNNMPDYYGEQGKHYPLMAIKEICDLPIKNITEKDAVLFLWVTSPILEEAFDVIQAWGFEYKASFIWDKIKHVMGHYNSVRHEFLLVCTRGSCQPDIHKLFDSVVSIERTEHSVKPEYFREIIDTIYPNGKRIELFGRIKVEGWDVYGNEPDLS